MRHGKKFNALGRKTAHRSAMLSNMASSLITHKRITTTLAKAKALRKFAEPILTRSKTDSTHNRREAFKSLRDKDAVTELFRDVAPKIADRPGGYLRIIKLGTRQGDAAEMAMIELVDFNEAMLQSKKPKTRRSRRGGGKKGDQPTADTKGETTTTETETKTDSKAESKPTTEQHSEGGSEKEAPAAEEKPVDGNITDAQKAAQQAKADQDEASEQAGRTARETEAKEAAKRAKSKGDSN